MTDWDAALEIEEKRTPEEVKLDRYSFYMGWKWGMRFHEYCRYFKSEYWQAYIRKEAEQDAASK